MASSSEHLVSGAGAAVPAFRDPNEAAVCEASIRLLREILDYQQRLSHLLQQADPDQDYLVMACRKAIRIRRQLLRDLPQPIDRELPNPWQRTAEHARS